MNVVVVDGDVSYPPTSGKRLRTLHLMQRLARNHRVTYIARCQEGIHKALPAREYLEDHGIDTVLVDHPLPPKAGPLLYARLAANLLSAFPYSVVSHDSPPMRQAINEHAARHPVDLWQVEWSPYVDALRDQKAPKVLIAHNVDALIWQRYHATEVNPLKRWYMRGQWRKFERFERRVFSQVERVVAVSAADAARVREFGMPRVDVVDNGIDRGYFEGVQGRRHACQILFLGALDWRPNLDAVRLLLEQIFPKVRAQEASARLLIVGRHPPLSLVQRVAGLEGVELHADVCDVRPYLAASGVMAVPLRIGGGSRLKILEALACGLPVISTAIGAEGLCLKSGKDLIVADDVATTVQAILSCVRDPGPAREMAECGRTFVLEHYDWDFLAGKLEQVWEKCVQREPAPC